LLAARAAGRTRAVVPLANLSEAALATGMTVWGAPGLADLIASLNGENHSMVRGVAVDSALAVAGPDLSDVLGQPEARLALEIAAAGGHHLAMIGPPGAGKTMLAARLPGVLPPLDDEQALEVTAVHSVAGLLDEGTPLITRAPFVDPHHTASQAAIIGGGSAHIRPGSVSLAHSECCSWTRRRNSSGPCWMRCGSRWRTGRCCWRGRPALCGSRRGSNWCWRRIRVRARRPRTWTAGADPPSGGRIRTSCPVR
jgi:energy-coupling factor transporter ATP-binding protein EcfA2